MPTAAPPVLTNETDSNSTNATAPVEEISDEAGEVTVAPETPEILPGDIPDILAYLGLLGGVAAAIWIGVMCFIHPTRFVKAYCFCKCLT